MRKTLYILCLLLLCACMHAQVRVRTYTENVRTLRVVRACDVNEAGQVRAERPFLVLTDGVVDGSEPENTLHVSFDEMSHDVHMYSYTVQMLNVGMSTASSLNDGMMQLNDGLLSSEYLKGFPTADITDYAHSVNTTREYTHYRFLFPNEDMCLTKSGAYRLTVYEDGDPDKRVAEVDFCVVEPLVQMETKVRANTDIELNGRYQQIDIDVNVGRQHSSVSYQQPSEFKLIVTQNNRADNSVLLTQPTFVEPHRLRYINNKALIFEGGNEYHHFDAFSCFYSGTGIDRVFHENGDYQVVLFPDHVTHGQYIHEFDSDGRFLVNAERTSDSDTEAEYMWVHWTLPMEKPFFDGALYVGGDFFNNQLSLRNRMQYDGDAKCYWLTALVKQGGYDYQYVFVPKESHQPSAVSYQKTTSQRVDGSYWQTENEYTVYVFWRPFGARYDRLVGIQTVQSIP